MTDNQVPLLPGEDARIISEEHFYGAPNRWRRFGEPVPAGASLRPDGSPDYGLFGPGSMVWEVLLHPAVIVFETISQSILQLTYKPIAAGIRDHDPLSRKARAGSLTAFDSFERFQRNSGMHAPMWLGDTASAERMAQHLHRVHTRVKADIIDIGAPELGGYDAAGPREAMWAALTEMDGILHVYEGLAFHGEEAPRRLTPEQRDRYFAECAAYLRLVGASEEEIPHSEAEVEALYDKYDHLFGHSGTMDIIPETGQNFRELSAEATRRNYHPSQNRAIQILQLQFNALRMPVLGALRERTRRDAGLSPEQSEQAVQALVDAMPQIKALQQPEAERDTMRLMWGPDGVTLIERARNLHRKAKAGLL